MRLGDHMMLIQLQLSTVAPTGKKSRPGSSRPAAPSPSLSTTTAVSPPANPVSPPPGPSTPSATGSSSTGSPGSEDCACDPRPVLDTKALAEASRNLTQTLKQLSSEVLTSKTDSVEVRSQTSSSVPSQSRQLQNTPPAYKVLPSLIPLLLLLSDS